jgi:hypothetical protein
VEGLARAIDPDAFRDWPMAPVERKVRQDGARIVAQAVRAHMLGGAS